MRLMLSKLLADIAIKKALTNLAPPNIPLDRERAQANDFFSIELIVEQTSWTFLVREGAPSGYAGWLFINFRNRTEFTILKSSLGSPEIEFCIEHYYRGYQINYHSPASFLILNAIGWHKYVQFRDIQSQRSFNRKELNRFERMDLLDFLIERTEAHPDYAFSPVKVGLDIYGHRWIIHPDHQKHKNHISLLLRSLEESGDIYRDNTNYKLAPRALATAEAFKAEERKHQEGLRESRTRNRIAKAGAAIAIVGILVGLFTWFAG